MRCRGERGAAMMIVCDFESGVQLQLFKNVVHMALNGVHGEVEPRSNLLVAEPFRNELDDLSFTARHADGFERVAFHFLGDMLYDFGEQGRREQRREDLLSLCNVPDGPEEVCERRILEDEPGHAGLYVFHKRRLDGGKVHHDNPCIGTGTSYSVHDAQTVFAAKDEVKENDIRVRRFSSQESVTIAQGSDHGDVGLLFEHHGQPLPQEAIVLYDDELDAFHG